jgi:hypothetical protein
MAVDQVANVPWTRKHDLPTKPTVQNASKILFPTSLEQLIEICTTRKPNELLKAAGSHWALSDAAISDDSFIETHDYTNVHQAMGKTLFEVVPGCLDKKFIEAMAKITQPTYDSNTFGEGMGFYLVHFETGKRVYQLYAELDQGDNNNADSLAVLLRDKHNNDSYLGPWGFPTLGGAGGQTVYGALTTGTHGGDFRQGPIADSVMAMHVVTDGGRHYWIEPTSTPLDAPLTDHDKLKSVYGKDKFKGNEKKGLDNFQIIRDNDMFNAVLVGAGRFGIVYSVVMRAVRQYTLHEERRLTTWQAVKGSVANFSSNLYKIDPPQSPFSSRFLQIAVCVIPHANFSKNLAGVTKRWNVPLVANAITNQPSGRVERVGGILDPFNTKIQGPLFAAAGNSYVYSPDPNLPGLATDASFFEQACASANFLQGIVEGVMQEIQDFIDENGEEIGFGLGGVAAAGGGGILAFLAALIAILAILAAFLDWMASQSDPRLGQQLEHLKDELLSQGEAGILAWQMIAFELFSDQQKDLDFDAISYAVMDRHDYFDQSCNVNVDSIEVFFNAADPMLVPFVDALLAFESNQELKGRSFVGYISLRFTGPTRALLGEQQHARTCAVEVAGLKDVDGVTQLIDFAITMALDPNFKGILHWGQRNPSKRAHIQERFGDTAALPSGDFRKWRKALGQLTNHGARDGFSSTFTRRTGLEVVTPQIGSFELVGAIPPVGKPITVGWDCAANPPATTVKLDVVAPNQGLLSFTGSLVDQKQVTATQSGTFTFSLVAAIDLAGEKREMTKTLAVNVA